MIDAFVKSSELHLNELRLAVEAGDGDRITRLAELSAGIAAYLGTFLRS